MITINYSFDIASGTAPYTYLFNNTSTCATFSSPESTLTADGTLTQTITYADEDCINNSNVTLSVTDANGCSEVIAVQLNNPCSTALSAILQQNFNFYVIASGGSPSYSYDWTYDDNIFDIADSNPTDGSLNLTYNPSISPVPQTSIISVEASDSNGCTATETYTVNFNIPELNNAGFTLPCSSNNQFSTDYYGTFQLTASNASDIDWSTLSITGGTNLQYTVLANGWVQLGVDGTGGTSLVLQASVQNNLGINSELATITLSLPTCFSALSADRDCYAVTASQVYQLTADNAISDVIIIDIEGQIFSSDTIDWTTFQFLNTPLYGTVVLNNATQIEYTITSLTGTDIDSIKWSVENECGKVLTNTDIINRDVIPAPVTVGEFICMTCNNPTTATDITVNDTGDIDKSTIEFTLIPSDVQYTKDSDNNFIFTALPDSSLSRTLQYRVANSQGIYSNTSNIILSVACAGTPNNQDITCWVTKTFDLLDYFIDANANSYLFAETTTGATTYVGQGGTIGVSTGSVDFTGITTGTYTFQLTAEGSASCTGTDDTAELEITVRDTPNIGITTSVNNGNDTATITFDAVGINGLNTLSIVNNGFAATFSIQPIIANNIGTFTCYLTSGVTNTITVQALSECNTILSDSVAIVN